MFLQIHAADAANYLLAIQRRATAMSADLDAFAGQLPEPHRSRLITLSGAAENIADQAHAAEAAINP